METHYGKHHAAYTNNLNGAVAKLPELAGKSIEDILVNPGLSKTLPCKQQSETTAAGTTTIIFTSPFSLQAAAKPHQGACWSKSTLILADLMP